MSLERRCRRGRYPLTVIAGELLQGRGSGQGEPGMVAAEQALELLDGRKADGGEGMVECLAQLGG